MTFCPTRSHLIPLQQNIVPPVQKGGAGQKSATLVFRTGAVSTRRIPQYSENFFGIVIAFLENLVYAIIACMCCLRDEEAQLANPLSTFGMKGNELKRSLYRGQSLFVFAGGGI